MMRLRRATPLGVVCGEEQVKLHDRYVPLYVMAAPVFFASEVGQTCEILSLVLSDGRGYASRDNQPDLWSAAEE
jgi:hypothetical protein